MTHKIIQILNFLAIVVFKEGKIGFLWFVEDVLQRQCSVQCAVRFCGLLFAVRRCCLCCSQLLLPVVVLVVLVRLS